ncbi:hypothetical protein LRS73_17090 [Methylobacterium currus]|uniref:hypothetical protein n=1 Tax=Methylobacterium currus TaxID=2051553 RepID=UPI001E593D64|nr:hypothetical protein [Methylobacterium currus]UHC14278.1 hypothetical protein LRS73_17090 [Methylobacterium currus]
MSVLRLLFLKLANSTRTDLIGWRGGRNPNAYFDTKGDLAANPDLAAAGIDPLEHVPQCGAGEGCAVRTGDGAFATAAAPGVHP